MTPAFHTAYSLTLFLALVALNLWTGRRHRIPRALRAKCGGGSMYTGRVGYLSGRTRCSASMRFVRMSLMRVR
jgi:hypothetical protein